MKGGLTTEALERGSYFATITAAIVAIFALSVGACQFRETQTLQRENLDFERETKAVDLFIKYNDLKREAADKGSGEKNESRSWRQNVAVGIAESIWNLRQGIPAWESTVQWMLEEEDKDSRINDLGCDTYDEGFVRFARKALKHEVCEGKR